MNGEVTYWLDQAGFSRVQERCGRKQTRPLRLLVEQDGLIGSTELELQLLESFPIAIGKCILL